MSSKPSICPKCGARVQLPADGACPACQADLPMENHAEPSRPFQEDNEQAAQNGTSGLVPRNPARVHDTPYKTVARWLFGCAIAAACICFAVNHVNYSSGSNLFVPYWIVILDSVANVFVLTPFVCALGLLVFRPRSRRGVVGVLLPLFVFCTLSFMAMAFLVIEPCRDAARLKVMLFQNAIQLKQIGSAYRTHLKDIHTFPGDLPPPYSRQRKEGAPSLLRWRVGLLPFLGHEELYKRFHLHEPWNSEHNSKLLGKMPDVYKASGSETPGMTRFLMVRQQRSGKPAGDFIAPAWIRDGSDKTIAVVLAGTDKAVPWTKPEDIILDCDDSIAALGSAESSGTIALFYSGCVRQLPPSMTKDELRCLATAMGSRFGNEDGKEETILKSCLSY